MAGRTIKAAAPKSVPQPSTSASFVLGSRPGTLRDPGSPAPRIKPMDNPDRNYGKAPRKPPPSPFGDMSGPF